MKKSKIKHRRLFLALWPDSDVRGQISACQQSLGLGDDPERCAQIVKPENLHLTLRFLGAVAEDRIDALCSRLATVEQPGFELKLQSFGYFVAPRILWLSLETTPPELLQLVELLRVVVAEVLPELEGDASQFIAHVSLCRNAAVLPEASSCTVIRWAVKDFALVESTNTAEGVIYSVLQRWPLILPATPAP